MVISQAHQKLRVELKGGGKLLLQLPNTVDKLEEHRGLLHLCIRVGGISISIPELVSKGEPLLQKELLERYKAMQNKFGA